MFWVIRVFFSYYRDFEVFRIEGGGRRIRFFMFGSWENKISVYELNLGLREWGLFFCFCVNLFYDLCELRYIFGVFVMGMLVVLFFW